jgi:thymidylate synthase
MIQSPYFNEIYKELCKGLLNDPDYRVEDLSEFIDKSFTLTQPTNCFATVRNMSMSYLEGELEWYLSGSPYLKDISKYSKFWETISDDGWSCNSNYGKILLHDRNLHNFTQFEYAKSCLLKNIYSKKAVMVIYDGDRSYNSKDNPCTMYLQYLIRDNKLNLFVKMRSSDIWFGLPYDVPWFVLLQWKMLRELRQESYRYLELGYYNHNSGSLHLYDRNKIQLEECLKTYEYSQQQLKMFEKIIVSRLQKEEIEE